LMNQGAQAYNQDLDDQLAAMREREVRGIVAELEATPQGSQPSRLVELSTQAQGRIETATLLASAAKQDLSARKVQSAADFDQLAKEMNTIREQLKFGKYTDPEVAGLSREEASNKLGTRLLSYRRREEELAQSFEMLTDHLRPNLEEAVRHIDTARSIESLASLPREEQLSRLDKLKVAYRERFVEYQTAISKPTAELPEWLKISPALKAQLGPAILNTAFGAADFGARIDDYVRKVADGTNTEADTLRLTGSAIGLIGGMASFIPVIGPLVSIGLALAGMGVTNVAEHLDDENIREAIDALRDEAVDAYLKKHPGSENYVYKSDVGQRGE
jgi:hypothetical protein